jgi:hypothetical protein
LVIKGKASSDLLKTYEAERMPVVAEMLSLSNELHAKAFPHIPESAFDAPSAGNTSTDPMMRSSKLLQLGVNYRWSSITFDERDTGEKSAEKNPYGTMGDKIRAGDRAPYIGTLHGESTGDLFTLLRDVPSHLVLFFPASVSSSLGELDSLVDAELLEIAVICGAPAEPRPEATKGVKYFVDPQGLAAQAYDVQTNQDVYVVIRPDGVIGAYALGKEGIQKYFSLLGVLN